MRTYPYKTGGEDGLERKIGRVATLAVLAGNPARDLLPFVHGEDYWR